MQKPFLRGWQGKVRMQEWVGGGGLCSEQVM